jgi:hypothetical protein
VDDYFAGTVGVDRTEAPYSSPPTTPQPPGVIGAGKHPPVPYSSRDLAFVAGCAVVGVAVVLIWAAMDHPRTLAWRVAFGSPFWLPVAVAVLSRAGTRRHRMAVSAGGAFVAIGSVRVTAALWAFANGTHHPGRITTELLTGLLVMAFFGGAALSSRRLWRPERTLTQELADKVGSPPPGKHTRRVWLMLADGRRVPATVAYGRQLIHMPKGVGSAQVIDVFPR